MLSKKLFFGIILFSLIITTFGLFILNSEANEASSSRSSSIEIKPASSVTLQYNYYKKEHGYSNDQIEWQYETNNSLVGLTVWAMDEDDYIDYDNGKSYTKYSLYSSFSYKKSGTWTVPHDDTWYILFINNDAQQKTVLVTYNVEFNYDWFADYGYIVIPIGVIIFIAIAAGLSKSQQRARARNRASPQQQAQPTVSPYSARPAEQRRSDIFQEIDSKPVITAPPAPKPIVVKEVGTKFCKFCGEKIDADAIFCPGCGEKLEG